ncbi:MAG: prephenate dehydratase [Burkholderiales bacterium]|nr:prephenate dehydratase [Burkholderiales bacterium]
MSEDRLKHHREAIDAIDLEILELISRRAEHARKIGHIKNGAIYRPEREAQVLRRLREKNRGPLSGEAVAGLFVEIISACRALEEGLKVAYLGPEGTFSQQAAIKHFGHEAKSISCLSIDAIFRAVESGNSDYAVVPVENTTGGSIPITLDLLLKSPLKICGEVLLRVHQNLLGRSMEKIEKIYSHAQSLAQCREWLNRNLPDAARIEVSSNAEAARLASMDDTACAIAGETAAEVYKLDILAGNIEDEPDNTTRFLVLGKVDAAPSGCDKTSLVFSAKNRPGAVHDLLAPFADHKVSMTKFESRPAGTGLWEYAFFVDIEGHQKDKNVAKALEELAARTAFLKIFGSYPSAVS